MLDRFRANYSWLVRRVSDCWTFTEGWGLSLLCRLVRIVACPTARKYNMPVCRGALRLPYFSRVADSLCLGLEAAH